MKLEQAQQASPFGLAQYHGWEGRLVLVHVDGRCYTANCENQGDYTQWRTDDVPEGIRYRNNWYPVELGSWRVEQILQRFGLHDPFDRPPHREASEPPRS